jgi:hypothetical protein
MKYTKKQISFLEKLAANKRCPSIGTDCTECIAGGTKAGMSAKPCYERVPFLLGKKPKPKPTLKDQATRNGCTTAREHEVWIRGYRAAKRESK